MFGIRASARWAAASLLVWSVACEEEPPVGGGADASAPLPSDAQLSDVWTDPNDPSDPGDPSVPSDPGDSGDPSDPGDSGDSGDSLSCTGRPGSPGLSSRTLTVDGLSRTFLVHVPPDLDPAQPVPLVFAHHGFTMSGEVMRSLTEFAAVADAEGFAVAFPDGGGFYPWYVGTGVCGMGASANGATDDTAFVEAMIDDIDADQCIDRDRVFMTGFSMGGYFSNHVACERPDLIRAAAPHSGGTYEGGCAGGPMPVMVVHGTADWLIDVACGELARDAWVERNGCSTQVDVVPVMGGHCERHRDCPPGGQVTLCLFDAMDHGWAGAVGFYGGGTEYEPASQLIWDFFQEQL
jgi:polyhydroxybutyrate depolymerase